MYFSRPDQVKTWSKQNKRIKEYDQETAFINRYLEIVKADKKKKRKS